MKVLLFNGSSNEHGCTYTALKEAASALEKNGIETEIIQVGKNAIRDCIGCGACRKIGGKCVFKDDIVNEVIEKAGIVILAMPSAFIKDFLKDMKVPLDDKFIISAIKGIVQGDYKTPTEYMHDKYIIPFKRMGIITGPTHAEEVSAKKLSYLTIVCSDDKNADIIGKKLSTPYMHLTFSSDLYGAEYASILKNIYAIAVGITVGLGYGDNFRAVLIANCAKEMREFLNESYPYTRDTSMSAYLGDLLVTCYSTLSRNRRLGLLIGKGCSVKSALNEMTMIAEGYFASDCIRHINMRHKIFMPIANTVHDILYGGKSARKAMTELERYLE